MVVLQWRSTWIEHKASRHYRAVEFILWFVLASADSDKSTDALHVFFPRQQGENFLFVAKQPVTHTPPLGATSLECSYTAATC